MGNGGLEAYLQLMKNKSKVVNACPPNKFDEKTTQNETKVVKSPPKHIQFPTVYGQNV